MRQVVSRLHHVDQYADRHAYCDGLAVHNRGLVAPGRKCRAPPVHEGWPRLSRVDNSRQPDIVTLPDTPIVTSKIKTPACVWIPRTSDMSGLMSRTLRGGARGFAGTHLSAAEGSRLLAGCCAVELCGGVRHPNAAATHKTKASADRFRLRPVKYLVSTLLD